MSFTRRLITWIVGLGLLLALPALAAEEADEMDDAVDAEEWPPIDHLAKKVKTIYDENGCALHTTYTYKRHDGKLIETIVEGDWEIITTYQLREGAPLPLERVEKHPNKGEIVTKHVYDNLWREISVEIAGPGENGTRSTTNDYDVNGRLIKSLVTSESGAITTLERIYDRDGNVERETRTKKDDVEVVEHKYQQGRLVESSRQKNDVLSSTVKYAHDKSGRCILEQEYKALKGGALAQIREVGCAYEEKSGRLLERTSQKWNTKGVLLLENVTRFSYDEGGFLVKKETESNQKGCGEAVFTRTEYKRDDRHRVVKMVWYIGNDETLALQYEYVD